MKKALLFITLLFMIINNIYVNAIEQIFFNDVSKDYWASDSIKKLVKSGIVNGYKDGTFRPKDNINVDSFIKLTVTAIGFTNIKNADGYWATNYINKALELSIIDKEQFKTFSRNITREEMASITIKALGYVEDKDDIQNNFVFIKNHIRDFYNIADKYLQDVVESYYYGLITGRSRGFEPKSNATRADAVTVILRLLDKDSRKPIIIPPVITDSDMKKGENNSMYFNFVRYNNYKNSKKVKKDICRISECPNGEITALHLLYAMNEVYQNNDGYVYLEQLGEDSHPIGIKYNCIDKIENSYDIVDLVNNSEVEFCIKHSKHDTISSYNISLSYKTHHMSYMDRYYKYQHMFDTMFLYLYDNKFPVVKEKFVEILTYADNMDVDKYSYIINLNDREMYVVIDKEKSVSIYITIKGGKTEHIEENESSTEKQISQSSPYFSLKDINGKIHNLKDYKGKKVFIRFWSSWCSHCVDGLGEIDHLSEKESDFVVLTIVSLEHKGEKDKESFITWFNNLDYKNMTVLLDKNGKIGKSYDITAYPTSVYINKNGLITKKVLGHETNSNIIKAFSNME
ncbi:S-layer homology domain-containing protein [Vallitalea sp.]|uniref:S-layer homology domain-containing protein n=1 Tax=Vallitalea sp. TaxID=1882829 RepID=UPI0025D246DE|nr:S-layer homology domain-containing protein [Vallitalea sp.]MCT4687471.1 S-layer homology domain-containing protein [Vallitalea sp.]